DEEAKAYTEYGVSSLGESEYSTGGSIVGNKRTFVKDLDSDIGGKPTKLRYTEMQVSPTFYASDAAFLEPTGNRIEGSKAIRELYEKVVSTFDTDLTLTSRFLEASGN